MAADRRPALLVAVAAVVALEALVLLAVGVLSLVLLLRSGAADVLSAALTTAFAVGLGLGLLASARGLLRGRRWARAPVVTWQLLQGLVAAQVVRGDATGAVGSGAVVLLVAAAAVVVGLFTPRVVAATAGAQSPPVV